MITRRDLAVGAALGAAAAGAALLTERQASGWRVAIVDRRLATSRDIIRTTVAKGVRVIDARLSGIANIVPAAFADKPRTAAWLARVAARPSVARALALAATADPSDVWAPGPEINRWG